MKYTATELTPAFNPIEVNLTIESRRELELLLRYLGQSTTYKGLYNVLAGLNDSYRTDSSTLKSPNSFDDLEYVTPF